MPSSYYDFGPVLSHNAVYNFILGARGLGKTYGAKRKAIRDFINKGDQFIYLRRYSTELKSVKTTFMADIAHEFPQTVFRLQGEEIQARPKNNDQAP
jgi:predicted AAA+ superfamily ATPase